jgi:hypothetical protein
MPPEGLRRFCQAIVEALQQRYWVKRYFRFGVHRRHTKGSPDLRGCLKTAGQLFVPARGRVGLPVSCYYHLYVK